LISSNGIPRCLRSAFALAQKEQGSVEYIVIVFIVLHKV